MSIGLGSEFPRLASVLLFIMLPLALAQCGTCRTCSSRWAGARRFAGAETCRSKLGVFMKSCMQKQSIFLISNVDVAWLSFLLKPLCWVLPVGWWCVSASLCTIYMHFLQDSTKVRPRPDVPVSGIALSWNCLVAHLSIGHVSSRMCLGWKPCKRQGPSRLAGLVG